MIGRTFGGFIVLAGTLAAFLEPCLAHHEAIFGPQSSTLITQRRFASAQYYMTNGGRAPAPRHRSHIGVFSVGTSLGKRWSLSATLPLEAEQGGHEENAIGVQDVVLGFRYFPDLGRDQWMIGVVTLEPPTGNLEHRAIGGGGGLIYGTEQGAWSGIVYGLGRTEASLEEGEKRGNRLFLGGGVAYEGNNLLFSPQLGLSWEHAGRHREEGVLALGSNTSVLMLHPTLSKNFQSVQTFLVFSIPVAQASGDEGWQRFRIGAGLVWSF